MAAVTLSHQGSRSGSALRGPRISQRVGSPGNEFESQEASAGPSASVDAVGAVGAVGAERLPPPWVGFSAGNVELKAPPACSRRPSRRPGAPCRPWLPQLHDGPSRGLALPFQIGPCFFVSRRHRASSQNFVSFHEGLGDRG